MQDPYAPTTGGSQVYQSPPTQNIQGSTRFSITPKWAMQWTTNYDFVRHEFGMHTVSLRRELHDWDAIFAFTQSPNGNFAFNFFIALRAQPDPPEVIVLTTFDTDEHVVRALRAGAGGFLLKHTPPDEIARAVRRVAAGEPMMSPEVLRRMMTFVASTGADPGQQRARAALDRLSPGERDVALLVAQGRTNQEIGTALRMSTATVKAYVSRILGKLDLPSRSAATAWAHTNKLA